MNKKNRARKQKIGFLVLAVKRNILKRFKGSIFKSLEKQGKHDLIPLIKGDLKNIDSNLKLTELKKELNNILGLRMGWDTLKRKKFIKDISFQKGDQRKESLGINKFSKVTGGRPFQGGSPGLGRGKS